MSTTTQPTHPTNNYATYPSLHNKVIIISGGSTGIGSSLITHFAAQGSRVIFLDINASGASATIDRAKSTVPPPLHVPEFQHCDLTDIEGQLVPVAQRILAAHPAIHAVVNNATGPPSATRRPTMDITPEFWDRSFALNVRHQFFLAQTLMPGLIRAEGAAIINLGSISWRIPVVGAVPYVTGKAGVEGLTRALAHEFGGLGVRVNSIMPGSVATEREVNEVHTPEYVERILRSQAIKRLLRPEDVARMALWLASDDSAAVTNQSFVVDGGWI